MKELLGCGGVEVDGWRFEVIGLWGGRVGHCPAQMGLGSTCTTVLHLILQLEWLICTELVMAKETSTRYILSFLSSPHTLLYIISSCINSIIMFLYSTDVWPSKAILSCIFIFHIVRL